jgi:hypothetical protein
MSKISKALKKAEHGIEHAAKDVGSAVEGIATQKIAETIVDVLTNPEVDDVVVEAVEVAI